MEKERRSGYENSCQLLLRYYFLLFVIYCLLLTLARVVAMRYIDLSRLDNLGKNMPTS